MLYLELNVSKSFYHSKVLTCLVLCSRRLFLMPLPYISRNGRGNSIPHNNFVEGVRFSHGIGLSVQETE